MFTGSATSQSQSKRELSPKQALLEEIQDGYEGRTVGLS